MIFCSVCDGPEKAALCTRGWNILDGNRMYMWNILDENRMYVWKVLDGNRMYMWNILDENRMYMWHILDGNVHVAYSRRKCTCGIL